MLSFHPAAEEHDRVFVVALEGGTLERVLVVEMAADNWIAQGGAQEVLSRLHSLLGRKIEPSSALPRRHKTWSLNQAQRTLTAPNGLKISLTIRDEALLIAFMANAEGLLPERDYPAGQLRTSVSRLKRKVLREAQVALPIENVRGQGYRFDAALVDA